MVDFLVKVAIDPRGALTGAAAVGRGLQRIETRANAVNAALRRAFLFIGGGLLLKNTIGTLAEFGQAMSTVRGVTGAVGEEFQQLTQRAQDLGRTTRFTATQAADSMVLLARAGFSASEAMQAVGGTLLLAQAGGLDLARATDVAVSTLRGFRLEVSEMAEVVDVLTLAAKSGNTTVSELGEGLKFVAPVAAELGVSLEATTAAMLKLSDAGLKGTLAGTGLRRVFAELVSPGAKLNKLLGQTGLTAADINPSLVGLSGAFQALRSAGLSAGNALEIFGQRGGPASLIISSLAGEIDGLEGKLNNATGTAKEIARIMDDNLNGALKRLQAAFEAVQLSAGESGLNEALIDIVNSLAEALRVLASNTGILVGAAKGLGAALGVVLVVSIGKSIVAMKALDTAMRLNLLFTTAAAVIGAVTFALSAMNAEAARSAAVFAEIEAEAGLSRIGRTINVVKREIEELQAQQDVTFSPKVAEKIFNLQVRLAALGREAKSVTGSVKDLGTAQKESAFLAVLAAQEAERAVKIQERNEAAQARLSAVNERTQAIKDEVAVIAKRIAFGELEAEVLTEIQELRSAGTEVTKGEEAQIRRLLTVKQELLAVEEKAKKAAAAEAQEERRLQFLERQIDFNGRIAEQERLLLELAKRRQDLIPEIEVALDSLKLQQLETQTTVAAGWERTFLKLKQEANDFASVTESVIGVLANNLTEVLVQLAADGKVNWKELGQAVVQELTRIIARLLVVQALNAVFGGGGGNAVGAGVNAVNTGFADGGTTQPGRAVVIGERGPEIFQPGVTGSVAPIAPAAPQAPPPNITVVNVTSMEAIGDAIASGDLDDVIINRLGENPDKTRQAIQ